MQGSFLFQTTVAFTAVAIKYFPHSVFLDKYRKIRARYNLDENEAPIRKDIQQRFEEVMNDINVPEQLREHIKVFNVHDVVMFHAGSTCLKNGAIVGIPVNFEYHDPDLVTEETISFQYVQTDWNTQKSLREFRRSLVLSENAQKFAMGQTILSVIKCDQFWKLASLIVDIMLGFAIYNVILNKSKTKTKNKFTLKGGQPKLKFLYAGILALGVYFSNAFVENALDCYREDETNKKLAELGPKYIEGGKEYYEKKLQMNKALRTALGTRGPYLFSPTGNEISWFSEKKLPISEQIEFFNAKLKNLESA